MQNWDERMVVWRQPMWGVRIPAALLLMYSSVYCALCVRYSCPESRSTVHGTLLQIPPALYRTWVQIPAGLHFAMLLYMLLYILRCLKLHCRFSSLSVIHSFSSTAFLWPKLVHSTINGFWFTITSCSCVHKSHSSLSMKLRHSKLNEMTLHCEDQSLKQYSALCGPFYFSTVRCEVQSTTV